MDVQLTDSFSMAELVKRTGVPASTIHHYVRHGLLPPPQRLATKRFLYRSEHVDALRVIRDLRRRQRLPLAKIADVLPEILANRRLADDEPLAGDAQAPGVAERILDVAIEAFGLHSYGQVSVADLCAGADVAKGTFYRYFDSKGEVFVRAAERVVLQTLDRFRRGVRELPEPVDMHRAAELCAEELRPGLPVLLELAKRAVLFEPEYVVEARDTFRTLAAEVGGILLPGEADNHAAGGMVVLDAVVTTFRSLVGGRAGEAEPSTGRPWRSASPHPGR